MIIPDGLRYYENVISPDREKFLLYWIDKSPWLTELTRRVQHYGWTYDYKSRTITRDMQIGMFPDWLDKPSQFLVDEGLFVNKPDQAIINEYLPGQGISKHIDCTPCFQDEIASLSLGGGCIMDFTREDQKYELWLAPRSLVVLTGESRYKWMHAIATRKSDVLSGTRKLRERRISITFRHVILDEG